MKFCKDCKYFKRVEVLDYIDGMMCFHESTLIINLEYQVSGIQGGIYCKSMRAGICGAEAKYYEPASEEASQHA